MAISKYRITAALILGVAIGHASAATVTTIYTGGHVSGYPSVAIGADGLPVIAMLTLTSQLRVAKCWDFDCSENQIMDITGDYHAGRYFSLAIAPDGKPAIAFRDINLGTLWLVKCVSNDCVGGGHFFRLIDPGPEDVGSWVDLAFGPDGRAAFAYQNFTHSALMLARCTTPGCIAADIQTIGNSLTDHYGRHAAISFGARAEPVVVGLASNAHNNWLSFFDCSIQPCFTSQRWLEGYSTTGTSLGGIAVVIGSADRPTFSYVNHDTGRVFISRCALADCGNDLTHTYVIDEGNFTLTVDDNTAIGLRPNGHPVVVYQKELATVPARTGLHVIECRTDLCDVRDHVQIEQSAPGVTLGHQADLAIDDHGGVVIAYKYQPTGSIRLARCNPHTCEGPGDRIFANGFQ